MCDLVSNRIETSDDIDNEVAVKEKVRQVLNKDEYGSIFGGTNTETVISESLPSLEGQSKISSKTSSKRADAEAELAAEIEQANAMQEMTSKRDYTKWKMTAR
ncbi:uncharacterized protein LOC113076900 [Tachysurus ichikawai]